MENRPTDTPAPQKRRTTPSLILNALCPACHEGEITRGLFSMAKACPKCGYDLNPESGYYLGAMMVGFLATSILLVPPMITMKVMGVDDSIIIAFPFIQYGVIGPLLIYYAKVIWVHLAYRATQRLK